MNPEEYNKIRLSFEVQSYEVDVANRFKPFCIQSHLQEAAYVGGAFCGAGYDTLKERGLAWILNRIHLRFKKMPLWGDKVDLYSWSRGQKGILWHRNYQMFRGSECVLLGTSAWTVLDIENRSLFRGATPFDHGKHLEEDTLPFCSKISIPKGLELDDAGSHLPLFGEMDTNVHVNNCYYTEWAMNSLPFDYLAGHVIKELEINYYHEIHPGSRVDFKLGRQGDDWFFEGYLGGTLCFVVAMSFGA